MYYLKTTNIHYWDVDGFLSDNFQDAVDNYHFVIESMMRRLPKEDWFNLQLWRERTPNDPVDTKTKSTGDILVRAWVY